MNGRMKSIKYSTISTLVLELVTLISGLIMPRLILSYFGSTSNGLVGSITQFLGFSTILRAGLGGAIRAALYRPIAENNNSEIDSIMAATDRHMKKIGLIIAVGIFGFACVYPSFVVDEYSWIYAFLMVIIIGAGTLVENLFGIKCQILLQADQKYYISTTISIVSNILITLISALIIVCGGNMHMVKIGAVFAAFSKPLLLNIYVRKKYKINWKATPNDKAIGQRWNAFFQQVAIVINENIALVVLTVLQPLASVSIFTVHSMVVFNIKAIVNSFTAGLNSTFGSMLASEEYGGLQKTFMFFEWLIFAVGGVLYSITFVMLTPFVSLYTMSITDVNYYQPIFAALMVISVLIASSRLPYQLLTEGAGKFKETRNGAILEVIINIAVSVIAVIYFGVVGVLIGAICAGIIRTLEYAIFSFKKILKVSLLHILKHYAIMFLTFAVCILVGNLVCVLECSNYINWIINAVLVAISSFVIVSIISLVFYRKQATVFFGNIKNKFIRKKDKNKPCV